MAIFKGAAVAIVTPFHEDATAMQYAFSILTNTNSKNKTVKINKRMRTCLRIAVISVSVRCICGLFVGAIARIILEPTNIRIKAVIKFKRGTICKDNSVTARLRKMQATQLLQ